MKQKTLNGSFSLFGKGLHTGLNLTVTFNPAPENTGYKIKRIDLEGEPVIDAIAENVIDTQRGTVLAKGDARVSTVEHGLAALYAMGVDNCMIQVNGPEFPILDGSAIQYVEKIQEIGLEEQNAPKDWYIIRKKIEVKDENTGSCITILPDDEFSLTVMCSFESKFINSQFATVNRVEDFPTEIAPARTFVFVRDIEPLLQANLIKGGDMDNAIVIYERQTTQERLDMLADMLGVEHRDATELGYIQHKPLVWENECTRHKLLDVIGDMALIGKPIKGRIIATRPGHTINNKFARQMRKEIRKHEIQAPFYDPNEEPVMDVNKIRELLPHRYPMQLVDKVISLGANTIVGIKNVTSNEPFFQGHFPEEPVMPGVLQIEAMAQCGGLLVLNTLEEPERWSTYFMKIDDVKFRQKVVPGDTLLFKVDLLAPVRHGISSMKGYIFVGDHVVAEATFTAQIEHLAKAWKHVRGQSLVLLDEFGAGTDPTNGAALAQAVLAEQPCLGYAPCLIFGQPKTVPKLKPISIGPVKLGMLKPGDEIAVVGMFEVEEEIDSGSADKDAARKTVRKRPTTSPMTSIPTTVR